MTPFPTQPTTPERDHRRTDHPRRNAAWNALLWLSVVALAVTPFPWWW